MVTNRGSPWGRQSFAARILASTATGFFKSNRTVPIGNDFGERLQEVRSALAYLLPALPLQPFLLAPCRVRQPLIALGCVDA